MADIFREDSDERGLWLVFNIDDVHGSIDLEGNVRVNLHDYPTQRELSGFVREHVDPQIIEYERHAAAYSRATPEERAAVLGSYLCEECGADDRTGHSSTCSLWDVAGSLRAERADIDRKREKGE